MVSAATASVAGAHKQPLRGFSPSGLMVTVAEGCSSLISASSFVARVLNAFHDLHASMTTHEPDAFLAAAGAGAASSALRFFAGGMLLLARQPSREVRGM